MARFGLSRWNWAHTSLLLALPLYAWLAQLRAWPPALTLTLWFVLTLAWLAAAEWRWPHRADWRARPRELRRDAIFLVINVAADHLAGLLVAVLALWLAGAATPRLAAPLWIEVPLAIIVGELGAYALHRYSHRGGWLWRVHLVHHRPEVVNATNNLTNHPISTALFKLVRLLSLVVLGFSADAVLYASLFALAQSFAGHANTPGTMGWLNYVIGTAELHRRHHSVDAREALNFGTSLPLWDQVFGTFRYRATREPQRVGLAETAGYPEATDTRGLLLYPLASPAKPG